MIRLLLGLCLLTAAQSASAATVCRFLTGGGVLFGTYEPLSPAPADTALNITVQCERNGGPQFISVTVGLGPSAHGSGSTRRMRHTGGSGDTLGYGLYRDASRVSPWGHSPGLDTVAQTLAVPNKGAASATFTVYGRIAPNQDVSAGSYNDAIQVTLTP